ncbi:MAG: phosphatase PAP2 family protein [Dehalococcoidia bacterium]|nr:phosphatase PAP2 family protein [Dehalococcoidia bacterium]
MSNVICPTEPSQCPIVMYGARTREGHHYTFEVLISRLTCRDTTVTIPVMKVKLSVAILIAILLSSAAAIQDYFLGDLFLAKAIQEIRLSRWEETMGMVSTIGRALPMAVLGLACFIWFLWKKQRAEYIVLGAALLSLAINPVLKVLVDRPRPTEDLVVILRDVTGLGFPSGHAYTAMVLFGLFFYLTPIVVPWRRMIPFLRLLFLSLIILMGVSRVYLGAHWPSDVLGGFLLGGIILSLLIHLHHQYTPQIEPSKAL